MIKTNYLIVLNLINLSSIIIIWIYGAQKNNEKTELNIDWNGYGLQLNIGKGRACKWLRKALKTKIMIKFNLFDKYEQKETQP